jgi:hypothetical protein
MVHIASQINIPELEKELRISSRRCVIGELNKAINVVVGVECGFSAAL